MSHNFSTSQLHGVDSAINSNPIPSLSKVSSFLRLLLVSGPKVLLTSRISAKCAAVMLMMCSPSLLFCAILTIPALLFQSPQQNAYFYFSKVLNEDPSRWIVLLLAGICTVLSLAIPATMPQPEQQVIDY